MTKPFLKWVGGKTALLPEILPRLPERISTYYEPFLGGGAVFFALASEPEKRFKRAMLSDANIDLIDTYYALASNVEGVIKKLEKHVYEEKHYYEVRSQDPEKLSDESAAARFIYLNKTCFNGLFRVNKKGQFNVPFGRYTNPTICDEESLRSVSSVLRGQNVYLAKRDFEEAVSTASRGDAVYYDPPYCPLSDTANFTAYSAGGFGLAEQERLRDCFAQLDSRGVHVLLSNSDTPLVRKLYKGFKIEEVRAPRRVNSKAEKRGEVGEVLISGRSSK